jgi:DNA-binding CsgD family transcriptional regulator
VGAHALASGLIAFAGVPRSPDPPKHWAKCDARLEPFPWWRHVARRIVAETAVREGWGDPATWVRESLSFFEAAGHERIANACKALLRRAGAPVPRKGRGDSTVPAELAARGVTSREMDVLRLVGDGLGNRAIAKRLFVSPRTVETHVASLMRKLGASDRAALVAAAAAPRAP